MPESDYFEQLFAVACAYVARGWSVIPVWGDQQLDRTKVAAISWTAYQHQRPTAAELHAWFIERRYGGLAVVTGRVSQLVVLDFDERDLYAHFQAQYPDLVATYTVHTRRGYHLYFRCLQNVPSRKVPSVDLQSDGRYVVAPPTVIDGHHYQGSDHMLSRMLTSADIQRIQAFFEAHSAGTPQSAPAREFAPSMAISEGFQQGETCHLSPREAEALYRSLAPRIGRNQALFNTSLRARDSGWDRAAVQECLADVHAQQPAKGKHRGETEAQRRREAIRTIKSAFSWPPRKPSSASNQLPNSVREALLRMRQTSTLRVIEGLYQQGIRPGQAFTYAQAVYSLRGLVGQWSIRRALTALDPAGKPIFDPSPRTPTQANADIEVPETQDKKSLLVSGSKPTKNKKGRPSNRYFVLPGIYELCERLGVQHSGSDALASDDLHSPRRYRQALHREYIKRRPGQYPRSWLASRLGVSISTEKRYNLALSIKVQPRYYERRISWWNLNEIPAGFEVAGTYLLDEMGKWYPARLEIAAHLLAKRHTLIYRRQTTNFYSMGDASLAALKTSVPPRQPELSSHITLQSASVNLLSHHQDVRTCAKQAGPLSTPSKFLHINTASLPSHTEFHPTENTLPVHSIDPPALKPRKKSKRHYRKPLVNDRMEQLAQQIQLQTRANSSSLSLYNARRLVDTYGVDPCEIALKRMVWLRQRHKITNAAGFIIIVSRVMWRMQNSATDFTSPAPRFRGEPCGPAREAKRNKL